MTKTQKKGVKAKTPSYKETSGVGENPKRAPTTGSKKGKPFHWLGRMVEFFNKHLRSKALEGQVFRDKDQCDDEMGD